MTRPIVLFLGPTLSADTARERLDAVCLPPCRMGDVFRAVETYNPRAIGIVDGFFESTPAVWHKEILYALDRGIPVFGASSMGALRAAELHPFGMIGVGEIFEAFASGALTDDDEVAVVHADDADGFASASQPMVNLRHGLSLARAAGILDAAEADRVAQALKALHYPQRHWQAVRDGVGDLSADKADALLSFVARTDCDLKAKDARALLDRISAWDAEDRGDAPGASFDFEPTLFWEELVRLNRPQAGGAQDQQLMDHVRVSPDRDAVLSEALLHHLVEDAAARLGVEIPDDRTVLERFRRSRGLTSPKALKAWMAREGADQAACLDLARHEARRRALLRRAMPALGPGIAAALRLRDGFGAAAREATEVARYLDRHGIADPGPDHVPDPDAVLARYQRSVGPVFTDLDTHAAELGFGSGRHFLRALIGVHLAATAEETDDGTFARHNA